MARLDPLSYLAHLVADSQRFREALTDCDPTTLVPSCPEWAADDLLWHLTEVQGFWSFVINNRPAGPDDHTEPTRPLDHASLLAAFDVASAALVASLSSARADEPAWSWDDEQTVGFTFRRQAHEALIHRVDAEQTAQVSSHLDPELAADGVEEVLGIFYSGCPPWATYSALPYVVRVVLTDTQESIYVQLGQFSGIGPESGTIYDREGMIDVLASPAPTNATIEGTSANLLLWLWGRADDGKLSVSGDPEAIAAFKDGVSSSLD